MKTLLKIKNMIGTLFLGFVCYMAKSLIIAALLYWAWPIIIPAIFTTGIVAPAIDFPIALILGMLICFNQIGSSK